MSDSSPSAAPLLTPKALCAQLSICYRTYSRLVLAGMPFVPMLSAKRYDVAEVTAWLRAQAPKVIEPVPPKLPQHSHDPLVRHLKLLARGRR